MRARVRTFDRSLRQVTLPALRAEGFAFDQRRTFRRIDRQRRLAEIIHFQLGQRSLAGTFTVNLGVFRSRDHDSIDPEKAYPHDCPFEDRARIGFLLPARIPALNRLPLLGALFGPHDRWWRFAEDDTFTGRQLSKVTDLFLSYGLPWFEKMTLPLPDQRPWP